MSPRIENEADAKIFAAAHRVMYGGDPNSEQQMVVALLKDLKQKEPVAEPSNPVPEE